VKSKTLKYLGYSCRIAENGKLGVSPWSTCPEPTRQWFADNRDRITGELKGRPVKLGTRMTKVIERSIPKKLMSLVPKATCGCKDYAKKMDSWGLSGCLAREEEIVDHLVEQSNTMGAVVRAVPAAIRRKAAKRMFDIAARLR